MFHVKQALLPNAELAEDPVQNLLDVDLTRDPAEGP
jgi:hypothetical protein